MDLDRRATPTQSERPLDLLVVLLVKLVNSGQECGVQRPGDGAHSPAPSATSP